MRISDWSSDVCSSDLMAFGVAVFALCWVDLGETNKSPSETFMKQLWTYPELLRSRRFWGYALCMASSSGSFYAFLGGAPLVAAAVFQMSPAMPGFALGTMTAGFMLGSFLAARFGPYFEMGRASCRERGWRLVLGRDVAGPLKKKNIK